VVTERRDRGHAIENEIGRAPVYEHMSVGRCHVVWAAPDDGEPAAFFIKLDEKVPRPQLIMMGCRSRAE
jgi:hypothetical protein